MADTLDIPVIDLAPFLDAKGEITEAVLVEAKKAADALHTYGILCIRDPRAFTPGTVTNEEFLDMLEKYFEQPEDTKDTDVRADIWYQLGRTPSRVELPRDHCERMKAFKDRLVHRRTSCVHWREVEAASSVLKPH